jgi:S1-C subfamily serine protease
MRLQISVAALLIAVATDGIAADGEHIGKGMPEAATAAQAPSELPDWDGVAIDGLSGKAIGTTLAKAAADSGGLNLRGRKEIEIYRNASSAVVLVMTNDSFGSGSYLGAGQILTNWHVVRAYKSVGVMFKPREDGGKVDTSAMVRADVVRIDAVRDLALLRLSAAPASARQLDLGSEAEIQIGADVHAIGHPTGEGWTYTKGLISQYRRDYEWKIEEGGQVHRASVIQTQTPINPGNSGGPLIGDSGKLLGVNAFKMGGEGINFAVSVLDVVGFLNMPNRSAAALPPACKAKQLYSGRNRANDGHIVQIDSNCDGIADITILTLDDKSKPIRALVDSNYDGKVDITVEDTDRDGRWDVSFHDVDYDGKVDIVGYHPDGKIKPSRFEKYAWR